MNNTLARMQTLVGQAGEALGITEDPLGTVVGARVGAGVRRGRSHVYTLPCVADTGGHQGGARHGGLGPQHGDLRHHQPHRGGANRCDEGYQEKVRL